MLSIVNGFVERNPQYIEQAVQDDLAWGVPREQAVIDKLRLYFKQDVRPTEEGQYWDADSPEARYEIKSRRDIKSTTFHTTMIPLSKCCHKTRGKDLIFVFNFEDGEYYIKYTELSFQPYDLEFVYAPRQRNGVYVVNKELVILIPVTDLVKITLPAP
jgi:hypothetical protein